MFCCCEVNMFFRQNQILLGILMHLLVKKETRHCMERLVYRLMNTITVRQISQKSKLTEKDYGQDKKLSGKTDKWVDPYKDTKTDFPENPN